VDKSRILSDAVRAGNCLVLGATYQLARGKIQVIRYGISPAG